MPSPVDTPLTRATQVIERPGQGSLLLTPRCRLLVARGPDKGKETKIEGRLAEVGTDPTCQLVLSDPSVSAVHFTVEPDSQGFLLRDAQSTNGTLVDGYRVQAIYLPQTAQIDAGETRLKFVATSEEVEIPLSSRTRFGDLLGHSSAMRQVFAVLERVAGTASTVLLEGESGTGKELAARALHEGSARREGPFVTVDCGALPAGLIESELFGYQKGAFTGAAHAREGLFEQADGGTLFLDEVGELPLDLQPKLLRVLETRAVRRIGENKPRAIDVRLVAATNRNLKMEVERGSFRQDLFFRLSVISVRLPALRERKEEIPRLVAHFMALLGRDPSERIPEAMMKMLCGYSWPGNVRELRNVVERLVVLPGMKADYYLSAGQASSGEPGDADPALQSVDFHQGKQLCVERFERQYLARLLQQCGGNISEVARVSGLSRQSCHRLLKRYDLEP
jgi:DNA-binding NtrC family response regulator